MDSISSSEFRKLLVVGDLHGDLGDALRICREATTSGVDAILQLGDFGYWVHTGEGRAYLEELSRRTPVSFYWIDGNHENFAALGDRVRARAPVEVAANVLYLPRGYRWIWSGRSFLAMGGAWSIDKMFRIPGRSWWPEETIREEDVLRVDPSPVDFLIAHDAPIRATVPGILHTFPVSEENRRKLQRVFDAVTPKHVFHGHYHLYYQATVPHLAGSPSPEAKIVGLADSKSAQPHWRLVDLEEM